KYLMLHHLLKLIWKRKSRNMMLSLEILLAFIVVFAIAAFAVRNYQLYQMPIGFAWRDQWSVNIRNAQPIPNDAATYDALKRALLELPEVEKVAFTAMAPYELSRMNAYYSQPDGSHRVESDSLDASDDFFDTMQMTPAQGHWFSKADDAADAIPTVINRRVADKLFPGIPAVGQVFRAAEFNGTPRRYRVSAVVEQFRAHGEYMDPVNLVLPRFVPGDRETAMTIMLRVKPGTPREFESRLSARLKREHNDWSFVISPLSEARKSMHKLQMLPLTIMSVIAAFLLVMVAFGLFGVLWQNTTQRIPEIGLRRALGADAGHIYRQIIAEQMLLSTAAMAVALVLLVQLPLTGVFEEALNWPVFFTAAALSAGVIYLLSLLCSLYPGWRAARLSPTQALHYE
ncbi:MAG TPA: ABC transporter permease, partial [Duganella sp.]|uniref:ABC transporter permease n=1 Tax=Duganella sp. TaxID=1904440 RepID=UPI002ECFFBF4